MKKSILFVGAFKNNTNDGSTGGQLFACKSIINSELKYQFDFILLDSTSKTVPPPRMYIRIWSVINRLVLYNFYLVTRPINTVLIFSSAKLSFIEKGLMVFIASVIFKKKVVFAPRSGLSLQDYRTSKFMQWFMPLVINKADYTICQGKNWQVFYRTISGVNVERLVIVPNWIDHEKYLFRRDNINPDKPKIEILYIGWLEEHKGILELLEALQLLKMYSGKMYCKIYGGGSLYGYAENFIAQNNLGEYVILCGWANESVKIQAFRDADVYVLPSHFEGFPNALLEAMASGLPAIATSVGAVPDIIEDGINGFLVKEKNVIQLKHKMENLINNPILRKNIGNAAQNTILHEYTLNHAVERLNKIL